MASMRVDKSILFCDKVVDNYETDNPEPPPGLTQRVDKWIEAKATDDSFEVVSIITTASCMPYRDATQLYMCFYVTTVHYRHNEPLNRHPTS